MNSEFLGARASNAGDDYHELWAARHAIWLLGGENDLQALTVEGVSGVDEAGTAKGTWEGVDCALCFGAETFKDAKRIVIEQLKYSASAPSTSWSVARMTAGKKPEQSVVGRLARAWKAARDATLPTTIVDVLLVSNQPLATALQDCVSKIANGAAPAPWKERSDEQRFWKASCLTEAELVAFCSSMKFELGAGSRFTAEERVLAAIAAWTESDVKNGVLQLLDFLRRRMRPEHAGEVITRSTMMVQFGAISADLLMPCSPTLARVENPIKRPSTILVSQALREGERFIAMHGQGGIGKTTALQEIQADLPEGSAMIVFDCYGGGTFMDPSALRHRPVDAYMQLINQTATELGLPLVLRRSAGDDLPRMFMRRLRHAAVAVAARASGALLVIAIDAADNAILAAENRVPAERAFVLDFVQIATVPDNVRFIVSARTGRLNHLELPGNYKKFALEPFDLEQTAEFVRMKQIASEQWVHDFHDLSGGIPRVQSYALNHIADDLTTALHRLRPAGKNLDDVFGVRIDAARNKSGASAVDRMCSRLIILPRPVPIDALAAVTGLSADQIIDICADLAPGVRVGDGVLGFADEDFEDFLRRHGSADVAAARRDVAAWMWSYASKAAYPAIHVAEALVAANRGNDLLSLVEQEVSPTAVTDPVIRREVEVQRLRLAIKVCNSIQDTGRALRYVLRGAEGMKTEAALRDLLLDHPDMAAAFAYETVGRLLLSDGTRINRFGGFLFQRLAVEAEEGDAVAYREAQRRLRAWLDARDAKNEEGPPHDGLWPISFEDVAAAVEAILIKEDARKAIDYLLSWNPWNVRLGVALSLPSKLIGQGRGSLVEAACASAEFSAVDRLFCAVPLAIAGREVASATLAEGLTNLTRRRLKVRKFVTGHASADSKHAQLLRVALTCAEILVARGVACPAADRLLTELAATECRQTERQTFEGNKLDLILRAFLLQELRAGRQPDELNVLIPKPKPSAAEGNANRRSGARDYGKEHHDELQSFVACLFPIYLQRAQAIFGRSSVESVGNNAPLSNGSLSDIGRELRWRQDKWRTLASIAAASVMELTAIGYSPAQLKKQTDDIHWPWVKLGLAPSPDYIAVQSMSAELHDALATELITAADNALGHRCGAVGKCSSLVDIARLLRPICPHDANAIFNRAVEVASHIDREAMSQIQLVEQLVVRGAGHFPAPETTARNLQVMVVDASVRLDGYDDFPWPAAMAGLAALNGPRAIADAARWDDDDIVGLTNTLPTILRDGVECGWLPLEHASALSLLDQSRSSVMEAITAKAVAIGSGAVAPLAEAAAYDSLLKHRYKSNAGLAKLVQDAGLHGLWCSALIRQQAFVDALPTHDGVGDAGAGASPDDAVGYKGDRSWAVEDLIDADRLKSVLDAIRAETRERNQYVTDRALLKLARRSVPLKRRLDHLEVLRSLAMTRAVGAAPWILVDAVMEWQASPAILEWSRSRLPEVISVNLTLYVQASHYGADTFDDVVALTTLPSDAVADVMIKGIEVNVSRISAEQVYQLIGAAAKYVAPATIASLTDWYVQRLADKVPEAERVFVPFDADYPVDVDEAIARVIFGYLGDIDLRARWRAAHAVQRLADMGCVQALRLILSMYGWKAVPAVRSAILPFYWLAARLWFVMAWERIANEHPDVAREAGETLLVIALDESFPHMLVRASAREACRMLMADGWTPQNSGASEALDKVNQSPLIRVERAAHPRLRRHREVKDGLRFHFDELDTKPYWYERILDGFADVDMDMFTHEAEKWIVDAWGYAEDLNPWVNEPRKKALERYDWSLTSNGHGSLPTIERIKTHLEWHAMWCAAGSLLKTEPLPVTGDSWIDSVALENHVQRYRPALAPLWSTDLARPVPLTLPDWRFIFSRERNWHDAVEERDHRAELMPADQPDYLSVYANVERRAGNHVETIAIRSALADPRTSGSLLRTLQTMASAWDYGLPNDGEEDRRIMDGLFRLMGWLKRVESDGELDEKDEQIGRATNIGIQPGSAVTDACHLVRNPKRLDRWANSTDGGAASMFIFETWGNSDFSSRRHDGEFASAGSRLLVHREQLRRFLEIEQVDLIIEVGVDRNGSANQQHDGEEEEARETQFDRIYRLRSDRRLDVAEGHLGAWLGDHP